MLPIAPFTETSGTLCQRRRSRAERARRRQAARRDAAGVEGAARPGQPAGSRGLRIRLLRGGPRCGARQARRPGRAARQPPWPPAARLPRRPAPASADGALERIADVPIYAVDPLVRRAASLQLTADARPADGRPGARRWPRASGVVAGDSVRVSAGRGPAVLPGGGDRRQPGTRQTVRVPPGIPTPPRSGRCSAPLERREGRRADRAAPAPSRSPEAATCWRPSTPTAAPGSARPGRPCGASSRSSRWSRR